MPTYAQTFGDGRLEGTLGLLTPPVFVYLELKGSPESMCHGGPKTSLWFFRGSRNSLPSQECVRPTGYLCTVRRFTTLRTLNLYFDSERRV